MNRRYRIINLTVGRVMRDVVDEDGTKSQVWTEATIVDTEADDHAGSSLKIIATSKADRESLKDVKEGDYLVGAFTFEVGEAFPVTHAPATVGEVAQPE